MVEQVTASLPMGYGFVSDDVPCRIALAFAQTTDSPLIVVSTMCALATFYYSLVANLAGVATL